MNAVRPVFGRKGMVVAGHPAAALAAWNALGAGGSVADAAIAAGAVLTVVLPNAVTLAGDAFILVHDAKTGKTHGLNASGPSPAAATPARYAGGIAQRGALSCTVPGLVGGWQALSQRHGKLGWKELFNPAIALAAEGFPVSTGYARASHVYREGLGADPDSKSLFLDQGAPFAAGGTLRQGALARSLTEIASGGASAFYEGRIAQSLANCVQSRGGILEAADFRGYVPEWVEPIATAYRGLEVRAMPPNSYGLYLLLQLAALGEKQWKGEDQFSAARFASMIRAAQAAFAVADRAVADPREASPSPQDLLSPKGLEALRKSAAPPKAMNSGGTAVVSVVDAEGNAAIIVQSIFLVFGSFVSDAETGILLNNRMIGFCTEAGHPNAVAPGKRPAHTLCPAMAFDGGALRMVFGTPGGPGQTITLAQLMENRYALGLPLAQAIEAPRWSKDLGADIVLEATLPESLAGELGKLGIAAGRTTPDSPYFGSAEAIERAPDGTLTGAADFRRDAFALGG